MTSPRNPHRISERNPFEIYLLVLTGLVGLPPAFGAVPTPGTLASLIDVHAARAWAVLLLLGAVGALAGIVWPDSPKPGRVYTTSILLEQVGVAFIGIGCFVYFAALLWSMIHTASYNAYFATGITLAYGLACVRRYFQLQGQMKDEIRLRRVAGLQEQLSTQGE